MGDERLVIDIETNGLDPTEIFLVGILDLDTLEFTAYTGDDIPEGLVRASRAGTLVGHHVNGFDLPVIERLTGGLVTFDRLRVIDTLEFARWLFPGARGHKLKDWGERLGLPKLESPPFDAFTPEMVPYCERDLQVCAALFFFLCRCLDDGIGA